MYRSAAIIVLSLLSSVALTACSSSPKQPSFGLSCEQAEAMRSPDRYEAAIVFDRQHGYYNGEDFNARSDWPSTQAYYQSNEAVSYYERVVNYQGRGRHNDTYRRTESRRFFTGYR